MIYIIVNEEYKMVEEVEKKFEEYLMDFDKTEKIEWKHIHSYRVANLAKYIAKKENLNQYDTDLAYSIGLLHDIGRFYQLKMFDTYNDNKSIDHGDMGEVVLNKDSDYKKIFKDDYTVLIKAVKNHNKYEIEEGLNERELYFSKLVRDVDKIDILVATIEGHLKYEEEDREIHKIYKEEFFSNKLLRRRPEVICKYGYITLLSFAYDINFNSCMQYIKDNNIYSKLYSIVVNKNVYDEYFEYILNYIKKI